MPSLNKIVSINVTRQTTPVRQQGFADVLILSLNSKPASITGDFATYEATPDSTIFASTTPESRFIARYFSQESRPARIHLGFKEASDADNKAALSRILEKLGSERFYGVCIVGDALTDADKVAVAEWCAANTKLAILQDNSAEALDSSETDDLGSTLMSAGNDRALVVWSENQNDYLDAAFASVLSNPVGSYIFAYNTFSGVPVSDMIDATSSGVLEGKNISYYANISNGQRSFLGKVAKGDFADVIVSQDFLTRRMQEAISFIVFNAKKIPYTNQGIEQLAAAVSGVLTNAQINGIISSFLLATRTVNQVPENERANRTYGEIDVSVVLTGAIQSVKIDLTLGV